MSCIQLPVSGSSRLYFRIIGPYNNAIGVWNNDVKENIAFLEFSKSFLSSGINVPQIYEVSNDKIYYLLEDLGSMTLYDYLTETRKKGIFPENIINLYKKVLTELPKIQITAGKNINYNVCYPRNAFDRQSMMWDLNYFKYYFLKLAKINFNEQLLEDDFLSFTDFLLKADNSFFLYRDFQSRNIMINGEKIGFIDYQGGRRGSLQYDLASLLYDAKADIPDYVRKELYSFYIKELEKYPSVKQSDFELYYPGFVIIRILQSMGAYGFRGFYEKKKHFLKSIPFALDNMKQILNDYPSFKRFPELYNSLIKITESNYLRSLGTPKNKLTIDICSFSYKKGIPEDSSGNGGGFVFDCRAVHNPGRYEPYKKLTGRDQEVKKFLEEKSDMSEFLVPIFSLLDQTTKKYISCEYTHLKICFGCTGGQHRSVYAAERTALHLKKKFPVFVYLVHRELKK
ncbi:MAG: phosphotransferase [Prolixibacteraceae bacterium]|nr:phosphotransferase [Prolixibacteraceae bacterium]